MVAIYVRVSGQKQKENFSVQSQRRLGTEFAKSLKLDYQLYDEVGSGKSTENRPEFVRLINDIQDGKVSHVWSVEYSRLSRSEEDSIFFRNLCIEFDVKVYTNDGPVPFDSPEDRLFHTFKAGIAQYEREKINQRIKRAFQQKRDTGKWKTVRLYGYDDDAQVIPEQAGVIRYVFEQYSGGVGFPTLVRALRAKEAINWSGNSEWFVSSIRNIIVNPKYCGLTPNSDGELIQSEVYEPIISEELWYRTQLVLQEQRKKYNRTGQTRAAKYILSGLLKCAGCGRSYFGHVQSGKYWYYRHGRPQPHEPKCPQDKAGFQYERINHLVLASFLYNFEQYETLEAFQDSLTPPTQEVDVSPLEKQLYNHQQQKERLLDLVVDGTVPMQDVKKRIADIQSKIDELDSSIATQRQQSVDADSLSILDALAEDTIFTVYDLEPDEAKLFYKRLLKRLVFDNRVLEIEWQNGCTHKIDVDNLGDEWNNRVELIATYYQED